MENNFNSRHFRHCENGIEINNNLINGPGVVGSGIIPTSPTVPTTPTVPTIPGDISFGVFNTTTATVAAGGDVPLDTNTTLIGTAISHTPGDAAIVLNEPGTYSVTYTAVATGLTVGDAVGLQILQDAAVVPGSTTAGTSPATLTGSATVTVTTVPSTIVLNSVNAATLTDVTVNVSKTA
ncbi:hypothetical protein [Geomicrobium sp. JCM 19039]|uniref:BclA C-terminal domain-containing protein n=1 Tax=Geomicrobium sp. JCM 19039 TaxID=1460636 RepID=UPI00045F140E|nr:hypothetical protein [Geomicrobium sp. JCM 19039]GAK14384.1 flagellar hook-length control protein FliK [Geomicrobium sp. JCM 19039]